MSAEKWQVGKEYAMWMRDVPFFFLFVLAPVFAQAGSGPCVEIEVGGDRTSAYHCLNQELQAKVGEVRPPSDMVPAAASSSAVKLGGFNQQALKQQYGPHLGQSAVPYRPQQNQGRTAR